MKKKAATQTNMQYRQTIPFIWPYIQQHRNSSCSCLKMIIELTNTFRMLCFNKHTPFLEAANCRIFAMLARLRRWLLDSVIPGGSVIISKASGATIAELM